ncbi:PAS domain-containing protein [Roseospira goensis]|uniref:histidine kinase n=1 Tax=Roseospira goensis TaxID=391922 RepID=A0A7W6WKR7_9PROT|nr:PAS domain S-box-containing protein [Roseospira goensis]
MQAVNTAPVATWIKDETLTVRFANPALARLVGWAPADVVGATDHDLFPGAVADALHADDRAVLRTGRPVTRTHRLPGPEGACVTVCSDPVTADGRCVGVHTTLREVADPAASCAESPEMAGLLDRVFEQSLVGLAFLDRQGRFLRVNDVYAGKLGLPRWAFEGQAYADVNTDHALSATLRDVLETGVPVRSRGRPRQPHGDDDQEVTYWDVLMQPIRDDRGMVNGVLVATVDATDRELATQALRDSEQRYRLLAANASDLITTHDLDGVCTFASPAAHPVLGHDPADIVGRTPGDLSHPDDAACLNHARTLILTDGAPGTFRYRARHGDGRYVWVETTSRAMKDPATGAPSGFIGVTRDVTAQVREGEALRRSRRLYKGLFDGSSAIMLLIDPTSGAIVQANPAASRFYGYPNDRLRAMRIHALNTLPPGEVDRHCQRAALRQCNAFSFRHRLASGEIRDVSVNSTPLELEGRTLLFSIIHDVTDRMAAERALRASEREKARILSSISDLVTFFAADDLRISWTNAAAADAADQTTRAMIGRHCYEIWEEQTAPCPDCPVLKSFRTRQPCESEISTPGGRTFALRAFPAFDETGALEGVVEVARDVTDLVQARQSLAATVADLERAQRIARVGNWSFDPAVGVPVWSAEVFRIHGRDPDQGPPDRGDLERLYDPTDLTLLRGVIDAAVRDGTPYDLLLRLHRPDQPDAWVRMQGEPEPVPGPAGHVVHGTMQDITAIKRAEDALARNEEKLRLALEAADDGIWDWDMVTGELDWSPRCFTLLGYPSDTFSPSLAFWEDMVHPDDRARVLPIVHEGLRAGRPMDVEYRLLRGDGAWMWVQACGKPVAWDGAGRATRAIGTVTDIDMRKRAEQSLVEARISAEQTNQAKSQFIAAMSHELRTPLNAILGFSEMMKDEMLGPVGSPTYREYAADIHASGTHLIDLIDGLMDLAKIEAGRRDLTLATLDLAELISGTLHLVEHRAATQGLTLYRDLAPGLPPLVADDLAVRQIVFNLLTNAIKFTPRGGQITVSAGPGADGGIDLAVADTGIGIAPADQTRLFEPFARAADAEMRRIEGTGLGLALVRSLAEMHGGTVRLASTPGVGSVFTVSFPMREPPAP